MKKYTTIELANIYHIHPNEVMWASSKQEWNIGRQNAERYIQIIEQEIKIARRVAIILNQWANTTPPQKDTDSNNDLSRKKVADRFAITVETVRNWERNRLIIIIKGAACWNKSECRIGRSA